MDPLVDMSNKSMSAVYYYYFNLIHLQSCESCTVNYQLLY